MPSPPSEGEGQGEGAFALSQCFPWTRELCVTVQGPFWSLSLSKERVRERSIGRISRSGRSGCGGGESRPTSPAARDARDDLVCNRKHRGQIRPDRSRTVEGEGKRRDRPATSVTKQTGSKGNGLDAMAGGGGCRGGRSVPWTRRCAGSSGVSGRA